MRHSQAYVLLQLLHYAFECNGLGAMGANHIKCRNHWWLSAPQTTPIERHVAVLLLHRALSPLLSHNRLQPL